MSSPAAVRVWESSFAVYRRVWRSNLLGSFVQPLLYLLGMGVGVGALVDEAAGPADLGVSYLAFLAPAIIATSVMMSVAQESLWPVTDGFTESRQFRAMSATPLRPADIVNGVALWRVTRGAITAVGVVAVLALFDETRSWGLLPAIPFAVLCGMAFALPLVAWSSSRTSDQSFPAILRFVIVPMFLFAGAFYPIDELPAWLQPVAQVTPLYHGVELCRGSVLGTLGLAEAAIHVAVLSIFVVAGWMICRRTFREQLAL